MANKFMKNGPVSLITSEMQIKTTMRYHFTPTYMAINIFNEEYPELERMYKIKTLLHCCWRCKMIQLLWKVVLHVFKKINNRITI